MTVRRDKLTPRQRRFVQEYAVDLNATQAAIRAGYSEKTARDIGAENLAKPHIALAVAAKVSKLAQRTDTEADRVVRELARVAFSDMRDLAKWGPDGVEFVASDELTDDQAAAVAEVVSHVDSKGGRRVSIKREDKLRALDLLAKRHGLLINRTEHTGPDGGPIKLVVQAVAGEVIEGECVEVKAIEGEITSKEAEGDE